MNPELSRALRALIETFGLDAVLDTLDEDGYLDQGYAEQDHTRVPADSFEEALVKLNTTVH